MNQGLRNKVYGYITQKLGAFDYRRGWFKLDCPFCLGEGKMGIHLGKDVSHCFKCEYVSNVPNLIMKLEEVGTFKELLVILRNFELSNYDPPKEVIYDKVPVKLPESFKLIILGRGRMALMAKNYMKRRGFRLLDLAKKHVGFCDRGEYKGYIIFPYLDREGKLIYFQTRRFFGNGPKFKNPKIEELGIGKHAIIYNEKALYEYDEVYIVESVINALTLGDNSIALSGKYASKYHISKILESPVKTVIIILDSDAYVESIKLGFTFINYKKVKVIKMPEGKDVNDLGKGGTLDLVTSTPFQNRKDLMKLKIQSQNGK